MNIVHWNPWRELDDARATLARSEWLPPVDITETEAAYRIDVELPAVAADDVNVSVKAGVLTVSGERKSESESDEGKRHRVERRWGRFSRSFRLPDNVDESRIEARAKDGVLYVTVAKKEQARPRRIEVH